MKQKNNHIILLRVVGIILVVLAHATRNMYSPNPHMFSPDITPLWEITVKSYIYSFHMPLFFWISGFVFYMSVIENGKNRNIWSQSLSRFKRLIIPLYATSFLILLPTILLFGHFTESLITQVKLFLLASNNDHLWFLKTLFIIFIFVIPFSKIKRYRDIIFYTISIVILGIIIYQKQDLVPALFSSSIKYFPFFFMGYISRKYEFMIDKMNSIMIWISFFTLPLVAVIFKSYIPIHMSFYFIAFVGIYFMYFLVILTTQYFLSSRLWGLINKIDVTSYSIYLFHVSILYLILYLDKKLNIGIPELRVALSFILGLLIPILMHDIFSKRKILSKLFSIQYKRK